MRALVVATVAKSLAFQAPTMWPQLRERGYELTFAAAPDQHVGLLEAHGEFRPLRLDRGISLRVLDGMRQLKDLLREEWDLVQLQTPVASALARTVGPKGDTPSLYVAHGLHATRDLPWLSSTAFTGIEHGLAGRTRAIAVVCQEDFDLARRLRWGRRGLVWRLPGAGVRTDDFRVPEDARVRRHALFVGELNNNKQIEFAVEVGRLLVSAGHVEKLVVIGDGPLRSAVQPGVAAGWIEHHSYRSDVPAFYREAAVLLHTSVREGLPRVIIEAQAAGVPVLARSNRGSRELVVEGTGTVLAANAAPVDWVEAWRTMAADVTTMRSNARRYDITEFERSYAALIDAVAAGGRRGHVDLEQQDA